MCVTASSHPHLASLIPLTLLKSRVSKESSTSRISRLQAVSSFPLRKCHAVPVSGRCQHTSFAMAVTDQLFCSLYVVCEGLVRAVLRVYVSVLFGVWVGVLYERGTGGLMWKVKRIRHSMDGGHESPPTARVKAQMAATQSSASRPCTRDHHYYYHHYQHPALTSVNFKQPCLRPITTTLAAQTTN